MAAVMAAAAARYQAGFIEAELEHEKLELAI